MGVLKPVYERLRIALARGLPSYYIEISVWAVPHPGDERMSQYGRGIVGTVSEHEQWLELDLLYAVKLDHSYPVGC